jgi:chromosome segregation ATPase
MRRRWNGEVEHWVSALRSGQVSPPTVEKRIAELRLELEDAVALGYESSQLAQLEQAINDLRDALESERPAWEEAARRRLAEHGEEMRRAREAAELPSRPLGPDMPPTFAPALAHKMGLTRWTPDTAKIQSEIDRLERRLSLLRQTLASARKQGAPFEDIVAFQRDVNETEIEIESLRNRLARTPRRNGRRRAPREAVEAERDIVAGRIDMLDVLRRIDRYREVLAEVLANDPAARQRIGRLVDHIRSLEDIVLKLRERGGAA